MCRSCRVDGNTIDGDQRIRTLLFDLGGVVIDFDFDRVFRFWAARVSLEPAELGRRFSLDKPYEQHELGQRRVSDYFASLRHSPNIRSRTMSSLRDGMMSTWASCLEFGNVYGASRSCFLSGYTTPCNSVQHVILSGLMQHRVVNKAYQGVAPGM
jgi:hypothetical protein